MTAVRHELPAMATPQDRAVMLTILSGELAERLSRHPIPPRVIVPLDVAPSRWRHLAWLGVAAAVGLAAATITIQLPDVPWTRLAEKRVTMRGPLPGEVAAVSISTGAVAATPAAPEPVAAVVAAPALVSAEPPPQASALPAPPVHRNDRELTWTEVHELQARLRALQFDPGPLDGIKGPLTSAAVRRFQESRGSDATGNIDLAVLSQVRKALGSSD